MLLSTRIMSTHAVVIQVASRINIRESDKLPYFTASPKDNGWGISLLGLDECIGVSESPPLIGDKGAQEYRENIPPHQQIGLLTQDEAGSMDSFR